MSFETTKDVLKHARDFHHHLSEYYSQLSEKSDRERVKMLLNYLSRHEKHLAESLSQYEEGVSKKILNTWFQFPTPQGMLHTCRTMAVKEQQELSVDGIVELALQLDECLVQLYQEMIKSSEVDVVKDVFQNLLEMEKHEEVELVRNAFRLKGL